MTDKLQDTFTDEELRIAAEARRDYTKEYNRKWREKNRERIREYHREWSKANPDKVKAAKIRFFLKRATAAKDGGA